MVTLADVCGGAVVVSIDSTAPGVSRTTCSATTVIVVVDDALGLVGSAFAVAVTVTVGELGTALGAV